MEAERPKRNLEDTLQALYESEINVTITTLWDGCLDFAFVSYTEQDEVEHWHSVRSFRELADAVHQKAVKEFPESDYAQKHGEMAA
ncbi:MAG TPA: hypothetical protein VKB88_00460 [Bryobacteraceae bacterium]|nr:hypothetical protein [Bryobacteraceae bacterium]